MENTSIRLAVIKPMGPYLFNDWYGRALSVVNGIIPGQVVLDCKRKQTEQVMGSKPVSSILS